MKRLWLIVLSMGVLAACDEERKVQSLWAAEDVKIDGKGEEWQSQSLEYFEAADVSVGVRNDGKNLYCLLVLQDARIVRILQRQGLTLWLDETGKSQKSYGIRIDGGLSMPSTPNQKFREADSIELSVLGKGPPRLILGDEANGPTVAVFCQPGLCSYEIKFPLATPTGKISLGTALSVPSKPLADSRRGRGQGGKGKGSRGRGGLAGMGNDRYSEQSHRRQESDSQRRAARLTEKEFWLRINLATTPDP